MQIHTRPEDSRWRDGAGKGPAQWEPGEPSERTDLQTIPRRRVQLWKALQVLTRHAVGKIKGQERALPAGKAGAAQVPLMDVEAVGNTPTQNTITLDDEASGKWLTEKTITLDVEAVGKRLD